MPYTDDENCAQAKEDINDVLNCHTLEGCDERIQYLNDEEKRDKISYTEKYMKCAIEGLENRKKEIKEEDAKQWKNYYEKLRRERIGGGKSKKSKKSKKMKKRKSCKSKYKKRTLRKV